MKGRSASKIKLTSYDIFASIGFITEPCAEPPVSYLCKLLDMFMLTNQLLN